MKFIAALDNLLILIDRSNNYNDNKNKTNWFHDGADITWMVDGDLFNKIINNLGNEYVFGYDNELDPMKKFVQNINDGKFKSSKRAAHNFRTVKTKVKNKKYIDNYMKSLEQALYGYNLQNIKRFVFDESIAAKVKRKKQGSGLNILTPKQMLSRLPILLAEIQAGNNFKKLKNEARQLIYSLYTSKQPSKKLYNILIKNLK